MGVIAIAAIKLFATTFRRELKGAPASHILDLRRLLARPGYN